MNIYLWNKFGHHYRVLPEFDQYTQDIPRTSSGAPDPDYDDFYIPCHLGRIKHGVGRKVVLYTPSGRKLHKFLYEVCLHEFPNDITVNNYTELSIIIQKLQQKQLIQETENLSSEGYCIFNADKVFEWEKILQPKIKGKDIYPLSIKNYRNKDNKLPETFETQYQMQLARIKPLFNEKYELINFVNNINKDFFKSQQLASKQLAKEYGTSIKRTLAYLLGIWDEYITYFTQEITQWVNTQNKV